MESLNKIRNYTFLLTFLYGVIGIIMIINPGFIFDMVNYVMGFFIIIYGIIYLVNLLIKKSEFTINRFNILVGVICISFGVFILLNKSLLTSLIPFCFSILIFVDAIYQLANAIRLKRYNASKWWINLIIAIIFILFAVFVMIYASKINDLIVRFIGVILVIDVIFDIYSMIRIGRIVNKMKLIEGEIK